MSKTRFIALAGMTAALYAVLTLIVSPVAYGPVQFRLAELLKPLAFLGAPYIWGLGIGLVVANAFSPMAGAWELAFMPFVCVAGGYLCRYLARRTGWLAAGAVYSTIISAAVAEMLHVVARLAYGPTFLGLWVSEFLLIVVLGVPLTKTLLARVRLAKWDA